MGSIEYTPPTTSTMAPQLAFLGLGNMGQAMSKNLVQKGKLEKPLIMWNRTTSKTEALNARIGHSTVAYTVEEAVAPADIIFSCLTSEAAVSQTFDKILNLDVKGKLFVECSTVLAAHMNELSKKVEAAGASFIAMPVFGEPTMAEAGLLSCCPAGPPEQVERIKPYLVGVMGRGVVDLSGQEPGAASLLKLIGNVFIVNMIETVAETHVFAEKTGLSVENLQKAIGVLFGGPYLIYSQRMASGDYYKNEPLVAISDSYRLSSEILGLAKEKGASLKAYEAGNKHMELVKSHTKATGDISGIYGAIRLESGLDFENQPAQPSV